MLLSELSCYCTSRARMIFLSVLVGVPGASFGVKPQPGRKTTQSRGPAGPKPLQAGVTRPFQCQPARERCQWQLGDLDASGSRLDQCIPPSLWNCAAAESGK